MFLIGRHTRSDEETGRAELIRSARVGRHAPLAAALGLAGLANLAVAVVVFRGGGRHRAAGRRFADRGCGRRRRRHDLRRPDRRRRAGLREPARALRRRRRGDRGRIRAARPSAMPATAPCPGSPRSAGASAPSRTSRTGGGRCCCRSVATVALVAIAVALQDRRDLGAGLLPTRPGRADGIVGLELATGPGLAPAAGGSDRLGFRALPAGRGVRLVRQHHRAVHRRTTPRSPNFFPGGAADIVNSYLAFTMLFCALLSAAYGVSSALRARAEETSGRAEPVLATPTSRAVARQSPDRRPARERGGARGSRPRRRTGVRPDHLGPEPDSTDDGRRVGLRAGGVARRRASVLGFGWLPSSGGRRRLGGARILLLHDDSSPTWSTCRPGPRTSRRSRTLPRHRSRASRRPRCSASRRSSRCSSPADSSASGAATSAEFKPHGVLCG